jgi:prefoldin subunit 5
MMSIGVVQIRAQGNPIEAEILPSEGNASTNILIRFSTKNATIGNVDKADIFWDGVTIMLNQQGLTGADGSYNYNLTVPSEPPLSDIGNHTIRVDSSVFNYGPITFNFTFTITEFVPSPEYVFLNTTYYSLLVNYTDLLNQYNQLLVNYNETSTDYAALLTEQNQLLLNYNSLSANYNSLTANYNSLSANYNSLLTNYNSLHQVFNSLQTNYTSLQGDVESLSSNYNALRQDYDSLNSSYGSLKSNYDAAQGELTLSRALNYVFIPATIVLAVTTSYLALRKRKSGSASRTRY